MCEVCSDPVWERRFISGVSERLCVKCYVDGLRYELGREMAGEEAGEEEEGGGE